MTEAQGISAAIIDKLREENCRLHAELERVEAELALAREGIRAAIAQALRADRDEIRACLREVIDGAAPHDYTIYLATQEVIDAL